MDIAASSVVQKNLLRQLLWPTLFTISCGAILVALGVWQLHRLAWKEGLLAQIAARADAAPAALPPASEWPRLKPIDYDYRHVRLTGRFAYEDTVLVFTPAGPQPGLGPGYLLLTPLRLASGAYVVVNRGFVPQALADELRHLNGPAEATLTGLMRPPQQRSMFTPADEPAKGRYFTRDSAVLATYFHLAPVAPFLVDVDATPAATGFPRGGTTERDLPNNHLNYALTWFGLAVGLIGVFVSFVVRKVAEAKAG